MLVSSSPLIRAGKTSNSDPKNPRKNESFDKLQVRQNGLRNPRAEVLIRTSACRRICIFAREQPSKILLVTEFISQVKRKSSLLFFCVVQCLSLCNRSSCSPRPPNSMLFCYLMFCAATAFSRNKFRKWMNRARHNIEIRGCGGTV